MAIALLFTADKCSLSSFLDVHVFGAHTVCDVAVQERVLSNGKFAMGQWEMWIHLELTVPENAPPDGLRCLVALAIILLLAKADYSHFSHLTAVWSRLVRQHPIFPADEKGIFLQGFAIEGAFLVP